MFVNDQASSAQTNTELVATPGAARQILVEQVFISADTAMTVTLESGDSTRKWEQYLAANGGMVVDSVGGLFRCDGNEALTYTSSADGNVFVSVRYRLVRDIGQ